MTHDVGELWITSAEVMHGYSDIVGSTQQAQQLGDAAWQQVLATHHAIIRRSIDVFRGREVKTTGDGFLVLFDAPARAVQCATAMRRSLRDADIRVRVGLLSPSAN